MKKGLFLIALATSACFSTICFAQELRYDRPAAFFEESLPVGNGRIGALVYGGTDSFRVSLNDITLWTGEPDTQSVNPQAHTHLPEVLEALEREDYAAADTLVMRMQGHESEKYQPLGALYIDFLQPNQPVRNYSRTLSLSTATASTAYELADGTPFSTECFASSPDSVIVMTLQSENGGINVRIRIDCELPHSVAAEGNRLMNRGYAAYTTNPYYLNGQRGQHLLYDPDRGIHFLTIIGAENSGGTVTAEGESLLAQGCDRLTLYIVNSTSFNGSDKDPVKEGLDYEAEACRNITAAMAKGREAIRAHQLEDYQSLFNRVSLYLGDTDEAVRALPTDMQLRLYTEENQRNPELEALYFQYGRYLLISSSRTPCVPANLQGLWNEDISPAWRSNYTININLEENYWGAETGNLSEMHSPLLSFVRTMERTGKRTAQDFYAVDKGWCSGHNSDIWAMTNPVGEGEGIPQWANWTMGGAWLSTHIWEHFLFTRDREALELYYPTLKGAAEFCMNWLVEKDGELITPFSTSPENMYVTDKGYTGNTFYGGTADLAITRECLTDALLAARELDTDAEFQAQAEQTLQSLRPYHIGSRGQLLEWYHDWDDADWTHRHQSHLIGVYPGHQITQALTPDLAEAATRSLEIKGNKTTGWSTGWRINLYARLQHAKEAYAMVRTLLRYISPDKYNGHDAVRGGGTYPNLFDSHSPFQIDGNFGGSAGITEMLVQSDRDNIFLLPACPEEWSTGSVSGICTRTGAVVDFTWKDGAVTSLNVLARVPLHATIHANGEQFPVDLDAGEDVKLGLE